MECFKDKPSHLKMQTDSMDFLKNIFISVYVELNLRSNTVAQSGESVKSSTSSQLKWRVSTCHFQMAGSNQLPESHKVIFVFPECLHLNYTFLL